MENRFDLVYELLENEQQELQKFYDLLTPQKRGREYEELLEDFLDFVGLPPSSETKLAAINRIVNLREDMLLQVIRGEEEEEQIAIKERAFVWVSRFYTQRFSKLLQKIKKEKLLSPFYLALLKHAHNIGQTFTSWQSSWMAQIVYGVNRELLRLFNGDEEKIFELLNEKRLLDKGHGGEIGDRSYSVLKILPDGSFVRLSYAQAFKEEVQEAAKKIEDAIEDLTGLEDEEYGLGGAWIAYFVKIKEALLETDPDKLIGKWADVDRAWMKITSPLQIGHPLEYYEDHYRKAVALEWDVRLANPAYKSGKRRQIVELAFRKLYEEIGIEVPSIYEATLHNLSQIQLYVGRPMFFYGSEFNGLFSAQVVPNDEVVSKEYGKKIFAYADMVLAAQRAKPKMRIRYEVFGKEIAQAMDALLEKPDIWHTIYDITTIGHELGHILWMDEDSEAVMNESGMFKLAEEFKATSGGLVAYFMVEDDRYIDELLLDHIQRSVSLIGWMEVPEVLPYYVEGLLHMQGLFEAGIFDFDEKLRIDFAKIDALKAWYLDIYKQLAKIYLQKQDSKEFLQQFIIKKHTYLPKDEKVRKFVEHYYNLYKNIGREILS